jgi:hypothetical protein
LSGENLCLDRVAEVALTEQSVSRFVLIVLTLEFSFGRSRGKEKPVPNTRGCAELGVSHEIRASSALRVASNACRKFNNDLTKTNKLP